MDGVPILSHPAIRRLAASLEQRPGTAAEFYEGARYAAVALMLRIGPEAELEMLLVKRADYEGDPWSGHIALPGGRREPDDASLEDTAVRETREEIDVDLRTDARTLGMLDELSPRTPVLPPIIIRPFVFALERDVEVTPSAEVAVAFWVPLAQLRDPGMWGEATVIVRGEERRVSSVRVGEHIVWGLTERILVQFFARLDAEPIGGQPA
jgi:8-oxo-dGTP pyrophosphatase MutT (NUDIX family)